jgi:hypothetical protein
LIRHYELQGNGKDLDAMCLWLIDHRPEGKLWPGNIDPRMDRPGYDKGKALWLALTKRPGASPEVYQRAAFFLKGDDLPLAESILRTGQKAYPDDKRWPSSLGRLYARVLIESNETLAQKARAELEVSTDAAVLAHTAWNLLIFGRQAKPGGKTEATSALAHRYVNLALSIQPDSDQAKRVKARLLELDRLGRVHRLQNLPAADLSALGDSDRMMLLLSRMRSAWVQAKLDESAAQARELLDFAARHSTDPLYGTAFFEAHITLGKWALRHGDSRTAVRDLMAAADSPGSDTIRSGEFEMNLPRALIDRGERRAVAEFYERMATKTTRAKQFQDWAAAIRQGINPDLIPTFSTAGCTNDPC